MLDYPMMGQETCRNLEIVPSQSSLKQLSSMINSSCQQADAQTAKAGRQKQTPL